MIARYVGRALARPGGLKPALHWYAYKLRRMKKFAALLLLLAPTLHAASRLPALTSATPSTVGLLVRTGSNK